MLNLFVENEVTGPNSRHIRTRGSIHPYKGLHWLIGLFFFSPQGKMIMQDKLEKERNDAKNNVEEYVYDMRDKLHGMLEKFVSESVSKL